MAEIPPAAAAPVAVELSPPVMVEVTVAVELADPPVMVALLPSAEERIERALAPEVTAEEEAEERASENIVS
jgi:hypothetical protein